ncbi:hypothetical protein BGX38DRAFT_248083 [Terfezia claveryi]|nr:hypothetical protein BGX38DRAFT_248083 [Terfezia claveryi]
MKYKTASSLRTINSRLLHFKPPKDPPVMNSYIDKSCIISQNPSQGRPQPVTPPPQKGKSRDTNKETYSPLFSVTLSDNLSLSDKIKAKGTHSAQYGELLGEMYGRISDTEILAACCSGYMEGKTGCLRGLIRTMPDRLRAVITAGAAATPY